MSEHKPKGIDHNCTPRVQLTYEVQINGRPTAIELPFVMGVMANLVGVSETPEASKPVAAREFIEIDAAGFSQVMAAL